MATLTKEVTLDDRGAPLAIAWAEPDYRAAEHTGLTTKLLQGVEKDLAEKLRGQMGDILRDSASQGWHPSETARVLQSAYGDALQSSLSRMLTISRTEQLDAYRGAQRATEMANAEVLKGWEWHSVLGATSCRSCIGMHGTVHDLDERGPDDHPNGRCYRVPITKSWRELGFDIDDSHRDRTPDADRWFSGLSQAEQRDFLGARGFEAWQRGDYPRTEWARERENPGWRRSFVPSTPPRG
jgi:hypothetical protein